MAATGNPPDQRQGSERMMHFELAEGSLKNPQTLRALEAIAPTLTGQERTRFEGQLREQLHGSASTGQPQSGSGSGSTR